MRGASLLCGLLAQLPAEELPADAVDAVNAWSAGWQRAQASGLAPALALATVALIAVWFWTRRAAARERAPLYHPARLFRELCRIHALTRREARLLQQAARCLKLSSACLLFVRPDHLEQAAACEKLRRHSDLLTDLRQRLFAARQSA